MAVNPALANALNNRFGTAIPGQNSKGVATAKTATAAKAPNIWEKIGEGAKNIAQAADKAIVTNAPKAVKAVENFTKQIPAAEAKSKANREAQLKEEFKSLDLQAREVLKKNAFPTKDGFILPSTTVKDLAKFEGLKFTNEEWKNYSAKFATPQVLNQPTGTESKIQNIVKKDGTIGKAELNPWDIIENSKIAFDAVKNIGKSEDQKQQDLWLLSESQREADARRERRAQAERSAGFDYLAKLRASQATDDYTNWDTSITPDTLIKDLGESIKFGPMAPFMLINKQIDRATGNNVARATNEFGKSVAKTSMEAVSTFASGIEAQTGDNTYLKFINDWGAKVADDWKIKILQNPQLNRDMSVPKSFSGGGYMDPAWYASTGGQVIPHALASIASSVGGGLLAGPAGAAAGAYAYSSTIEAGSMYDMMITEGYSLQEAREVSGVYKVVAGLLDQVVPGEIGGRLINSASKKLLAEAARETTKDTLTQTIKKVGWTTIKEAGTEGAQQLAQNIALGFYDKTQDIWDNVLDSFVAGAFGGGIFSGFDVKSTPDVSIRSEEVNGAGPTTMAAGESGVAQATDKSSPVSQMDNVTKEKITADVASLLDASRAQGASVALGEQLQMMFPNNDTIRQLTEEAREGIKEMNKQAEVLIREHADTTKQTIVDQGGVQIALGTTPDGKYVATGRVTVDKAGFSVPFSTDETFSSKEAAVSSVATKLSAYVTKKLSSSGITNTQQAEAIIQTLSGTMEGINTIAQTPRKGDMAKYASEEALYTELNYTPIARLDMAITPKEYYIERVSTQAYKTGVKSGEVQSDVTLKQYQYRNRSKWNEMYAQAVADANVAGITRDAVADALGDTEKVTKNGVSGVQSNEDSKTNTKTMSGVDAKLMEEAKKYKTAEEFVKEENKKGRFVFRAESEKSNTGIRSSDFGRGEYYSIDYDTAMAYGGKNTVMKVAIAPVNPYTVDVGTEFSDVIKLANSKGYEGSKIGEALDFLRDSGGHDAVVVKEKDGRDFVVFKETPQSKIELESLWNAAQTEEPKTTPKQKDRDRTVSKVSERMASEYPELTTATFETVNLEEQIAKAVDTIAKDRQEAFRIAMGVTDAPNYESIAVNIAMTEKALEEGNFELAQQLITNRSLRQTEAGQSIVMERASITDNSPQKYMREILNTRLSNLGAKYLSGVTDKVLHETPQKRAIAKIKEEVAAAKKKISKKKQFDLSQAQDFISSLACK